MANYRLDNLNANQYQENRKVIAERGKQPLSAPIGNYSLDSQGRPILPHQQEMVNDKSFAQLENNPSSNKVYYMDDYTSTLNNNQFDQRGSSNYNQAERPSGSANYRLDQVNDYPRYNSYQDTYVNQRPSQNFQQKFKKIFFKQPHSLTRGLPQGKVKILVLYLVLYLSMLWAGWQIMPFNKVNQLLVEGHQYLTVETVLEGVDIEGYDAVKSILAYRPELENHILTNHPLLKDVKISRDSWKYLTFTVQEHEIVGRIRRNNLIYPLLSNGQIIETPVELATLQSEAYHYLPLIEGNFSPTNLENLGQSIEQIEPSIVSQFTTIHAAEDADQPEHIIVEMEDGNQIYAVIPTFAQKVNFYPNIVNQLEGRQGVIDLEVGAYFTPYSNIDNSIKLNNS